MKPKYKKHIFICTNERPLDNPKGDCIRCGGMDIRMKFVKLINQHGLKGKVRANKSGCLDACELGAVVVIYTDNIWYTRVEVHDIDEIFVTFVLKRLYNKRENKEFELINQKRRTIVLQWRPL